MLKKYKKTHSEPKLSMPLSSMPIYKAKEDKIFKARDYIEGTFNA